MRPQMNGHGTIETPTGVYVYNYIICIYIYICVFVFSFWSMEGQCLSLEKLIGIYEHELEF